MDAAIWNRYRPGGQVRVVGDAARVRVDPRRIESLETVAEPDRARLAEAEGGVVDLEVAAVRRQLEPRGEIGAPAVGERLLDQHLWRNTVDLDVGRVRHREPLDRREPEATVPASRDAVLRVVALGAAHPVRGRELDGVDATRRVGRDGVQLGEADAEHPVIRRQPEIPVSVVDRALNRVVKEPLRSSDRS